MKQPLEPALLIVVGSNVVCLLIAAFIWFTRRGPDESARTDQPGTHG